MRRRGVQSRAALSVGRGSPGPPIRRCVPPGLYRQQLQLAPSPQETAAAHQAAALHGGPGRTVRGSHSGSMPPAGAAHGEVLHARDVTRTVATGAFGRLFPCRRSRCEGLGSRNPRAWRSFPTGGAVRPQASLEHPPYGGAQKFCSRPSTLSHAPGHDRAGTSDAGRVLGSPPMEPLP